MCQCYKPDGKWQVWAEATGSWTIGSFDTYTQAKEAAALFNAKQPWPPMHVVEPDFRDPATVDHLGRTIISGSLPLLPVLE